MTSLTRRQLAKLLMASPVALMPLASCGQEAQKQVIDSLKQTAVAIAQQTAEAELKKHLPTIPELPKLPELPKFPDLPSLGWTFSRMPAAGEDWRNGFGAIWYAKQQHVKEVESKKVGGTYKSVYSQTSGLHGGIDLGYFVKEGPKPGVFARIKGKVVGLSQELVGGKKEGLFNGDAQPNVVVKVGNYYVVYGHVVIDANLGINSDVSDDTKIGVVYDQDKIENTHLHLSIRIDSRSHNPLYFFKKETVEKISWGRFEDGETPWGIRSFLYNSTDVANYWVDAKDPDLDLKR